MALMLQTNHDAYQAAESIEAKIRTYMPHGVTTANCTQVMLLCRTLNTVLDIWNEQAQEMWKLAKKER